MQLPAPVSADKVLIDAEALRRTLVRQPFLAAFRRLRRVKFEPFGIVRGRWQVFRLRQLVVRVLPEVHSLRGTEGLPPTLQRRHLLSPGRGWRLYIVLIAATTARGRQGR